MKRNIVKNQRMWMGMGASMEIGLKEAFGKRLTERRMITSIHLDGLRRQTREQGPWRLQNQASHRQYKATKTERAIS